MRVRADSTNRKIAAPGRVSRTISVEMERGFWTAKASGIPLHALMSQLASMPWIQAYRRLRRIT